MLGGPHLAANDSAGEHYAFEKHDSKTCLRSILRVQESFSSLAANLGMLAHQHCFRIGKIDISSRE